MGGVCTLGAGLYARASFLTFLLVSGSLASVLVTYFLGAVLDQYVGLLSWVGAAYLLWMARHTLRSSAGPEGQAPEAPGFLTGLLVQLTNVKIMVFCLMAMTSFVLPYTRSFWALLAVGLFLPFTGPVANLAWLFAGAALQKLFANHRKAVDIGCAAALALCAVRLALPH